MRGLIDDNCVFDCLMNPETAVTFTCGHFNQVVFAVFCVVIRKQLNAMPFLHEPCPVHTGSDRASHAYHLEVCHV